MWSSIENLKENLNKIALDVHEDDEDGYDDLHSYRSTNGIGGLSDSDRRHSRSISISNGVESPGHHEVYIWLSIRIGLECYSEYWNDKFAYFLTQFL